MRSYTETLQDVIEDDIRGKWKWRILVGGSLSR